MPISLSSALDPNLRTFQPVTGAPGDLIRRLTAAPAKTLIECIESLLMTEPHHGELSAAFFKTTAQQPDTRRISPSYPKIKQTTLLGNATDPMRVAIEVGMYSALGAVWDKGWRPVKLELTLSGAVLEDLVGLVDLAMAPRPTKDQVRAVLLDDFLRLSERSVSDLAEPDVAASAAKFMSQRIPRSILEPPEAHLESVRRWVQGAIGSACQSASPGFSGASAVASPATSRPGNKDLAGDSMSAVRAIFGGEAEKRDATIVLLGHALDAIAGNQERFRILDHREFVLSLVDVAGKTASVSSIAQKIECSAEEASRMIAVLYRRSSDRALQAEHVAVRPRSEPLLSGLVHTLPIVLRVAEELNMDPSRVLLEAKDTIIAVAREFNGLLEIDRDQQDAAWLKIGKGVPIEAWPRFQTGKTAAEARLSGASPRDFKAFLKEAVDAGPFFLGVIRAIEEKLPTLDPGLASSIAASAYWVLLKSGEWPKQMAALEAQASGLSIDLHGEIDRLLRQEAGEAMGPAATPFIAAIQAAWPRASARTRDSLRGALEIIAGSSGWWKTAAREALEELGA